MRPITSTEVVQKGITELHLQFFVPPGIIDVRQKKTHEAEDGGGTGDVDDTGEIVVVGGVPVVDSIKIVSQTLHMGKGGTALVDVVIEVADFPGVTKYEMKVSKI